MTPEQFEEVLQRASEILTDNVRASTLYHGPDEFEHGCLDMLKVAAKDCGATVGPTFHPRAFPDIKANGFGVEVKYSKRDTWHAVGNSVFEGMRDESVGRIYVLFGKIGGTPEVRWGRYEDCVPMSEYPIRLVSSWTWSPTILPCSIDWVSATTTSRL